MGDKVILRCPNCEGEHGSSKCPHKDTVLAGASMRDGGNRRGDAMQTRRRDDTTSIRISNLSESTTEADLEELVKPLGYFKKRFLAKDRTTNLCKGFAYVRFKTKAEAARAISHLNGYTYDHLILSVDWSKPRAQQN